MTKRWTWMALLLIALAAFWGCSDDDENNPVNPGTTAFETMAAAGAEYVNDSADCPGVISAEALYNNGPQNYEIIDLRSAQAYATGHIAGAINVPNLGDLLGAVAAAGITTSDQIVVACYTGQSAGHAKIALELMGYENVQSLGFGMASWNDQFASSWSNNTGNELTTPETAGNNGDLTAHDFPVLTESNGTVVAARVQAMLDGGFKGIDYSTLVTNGLDNYFIINYFGPDDYAGSGTVGVPGHIPGAYQFTPYASVGIDQLLPNLPTDMPIVVYCWTGQHSSQVTAYLNMLGYDAYSLKFGSNRLFHDQLTAHKWVEASASHQYPVAIGFEPSATFAAMAAAGAEYVNDSADCPGVISAEVLYNNGVQNYTVVDLRSADAYAAGHIAGAVNAPTLGEVVGVVEANTTSMSDPIVVACYTGQSAGHAKIALELLGYENVQSLLWGMASWNSTLAGSWSNNTGDALRERRDHEQQRRPGRARVPGARRLRPRHGRE